MPIQYLMGEVARPSVPYGMRAVILHAVNDCGVWGSGVALALSDTYGTEQRDQYVAWLRNRPRPCLGDVLLTRTQDPRIHIGYLLCQKGLQSPQNENPLVYAALAKCLNHVAERARTMHATIHTTRIGHGRAGADWRRVEALLTRAAHNQSITVYTPPTKTHGDIQSFRRNE